MATQRLSQPKNILAVNQPRQQALLDQIYTLRQQIRERENLNNGNYVDPRVNEDPKFKAEWLKRRKQRETEIADFKKQLTATEKELATVQSHITEARQTIADAASKADSADRINAHDLVQEAIKQAPSRDSYLRARQKLQELRLKYQQTERELHILETTALQEDSPDAKAKQLLASENVELPKMKAEDDFRLRRRALTDNIKTLHSAIHLQEGDERRLQQMYANEVQIALRPTLREIVASISDGVTAAQQATHEFQALGLAFAVETQSQLPTVLFTGRIDIDHEIDWWSTSMRKDNLL